MKKFCNALVLIIFLSTSSINAIPEPIAGGISIVTGGLTYWFTKDRLGAFSPFASLGVGGLTYLFLYQYTPSGRFNRAYKIFERINRNHLLTTEFNSSNALYEALKEEYVTSSYYLAEAYERLSRLHKLGHDAIELLISAKSEYSIDELIPQKSEKLLREIGPLIEKLKQLLKAIREHPDFQQQMQSYKQEQAAKEALAVQQQIAHAQQEQAMAQWHNAYNK